MKRVLVTGGNGYIGRRVVAQLLSRGHSLIVISRDRVKENKKIKYIHTNDFFSQPIEWYKKILTDVDVVIHLAWIATPGEYLNSLKNIDCLIGTLNFSRAILQSDVETFIGIGTCLEYDIKNQVLSCQSPINPSSLYGSTKAAAYFLLRNMFEKTAIKFKWARLFYVYGGDEDKRRLMGYVNSNLENNQPVFIKNPWAVRDYLHVDLVADKITELIGPSDNLVNICSGVGRRIKEIVEERASFYDKVHLIVYEIQANPLVDDVIIGR